MHHRTLTLVGLSISLFALPASAAVVLTSATRAVQDGTTFTGFGAFSDSTSGSGFAPPNGTGSWNAAQTSSITAASISYDATYGAGITSGGPQVTYGGGVVTFAFEFDITGTPQDITYSWNGWFQNAPRLTDPSLTVTSLDTAGATMMRTLPVGHYSFTASDGISVFAQGLPGASRHAVGSISFVPTPASAGTLLALGSLGVLRRRRS